MSISDNLYNASLPLAGIKAVIIDLDGTMIDSVPDFHIVLNQVRAEFSLPSIDITPIRHFVGRGSENLVRSSLEVDLDSDEAKRIMPQAMTFFYKHYLNVNGQHCTVYPEVKEGLSAMLAKKLRLACITNKPAIFTEPLMAKMGLYSYFEFIYSADSFPKKKPDPLPSMMACRKFGLPPHQVLAIGDSINDAQAAYAAGCPLFIVPYGYNHGKPPEKINSNGIVSSLLHAANLIS